MPDAPDVALVLDGASYKGWKTISVSRGMAQVAGKFSLSVTEKHPGNQTAYKFRLNSPCQVTLAGKTVITGHVESIKPSYSDGSHTLTLEGRDLTGDLVDCSHLGPPSQWRGQNILQIAQAVCGPFRITAHAEVAVGAVFADERINEGQTVLAFLAKLAKARGLLLLSYGDGRLVISQAGTLRSGGALELGRNVKSGSAEFSAAIRHSEYILKGQGAAQPWEGSTEEEAADFQALYTSPQARATDPVVSRHRPLVIVAGAKADAASLAQRASFEAQNRAGRSQRATHTVQGWLNASGKLWQINQLVPVRDGFLGINRDMLIESLDYRRSEEQGATTEITTVHPDAYLPKPESDAAGGITGEFDEE